MNKCSGRVKNAGESKKDVSMEIRKENAMEKQISLSHVTVAVAILFCF